MYEIIYISGDKPKGSDLEEMFDEKSISFNYQSDLAPFLANEGGGGAKPRQIIYVDMGEIKEDKAFKTMQRLSKELHFNPPKEEDRAKFERKAWNDYTIFLPFRLFIDNKDFSQLKEKILCIITEEKLPNLKDAKTLLLDENNPCYHHIAINLEEKHYKFIKNDEKIKQRLKEYFKEFGKALDEKVRFRKENALNENDVLEYFKTHLDLALRFKTLLDKELAHIRQMRPDIIASWKYYEEFERICKEGIREA